MVSVIFSPVTYSRTHQCLHRGRALAGLPEILVAGSFLDLRFVQSQALSGPMLWRKICLHSRFQSQKPGLSSELFR